MENLKKILEEATRKIVEETNSINAQAKAKAEAWVKTQEAVAELIDESIGSGVNPVFLSWAVTPARCGDYAYEGYSAILHCNDRRYGEPEIEKHFCGVLVREGSGDGVCVKIAGRWVTLTGYCLTFFCGPDMRIISCEEAFETYDEE